MITRMNLTILIIFSMLAGACVDDDPVIKDDGVLKRIMDSLPRNWYLTVGKDEIVFERAGDVWVLETNLINAPDDPSSEQEKIERIKTNGVITKARLVYRYEAPWSDEKRRQADAANAEVGREIAELVEKYRIAHLYDARLSSKGGEFFRQGTPEEEKRIEGYRREKAELEKRIIVKPDGDTSKYSLFFAGGSGYSDEFHLVYPAEASIEAYTIMNLIH